MNKELYCVNLALRYKTGDTYKVENDTLYTEVIPTNESLKEMAIKYSCDVLMNVVGTLKVWSEEKQKESSKVVYLPEANELEDNSQIHQIVKYMED